MSSKSWPEEGGGDRGKEKVRRKEGLEERRVGGEKGWRRERLKKRIGGGEKVWRREEYREERKGKRWTGWREERVRREEKEENSTINESAQVNNVCFVREHNSKTVYLYLAGNGQQEINL